MLPPLDDGALPIVDAGVAADVDVIEMFDHALTLLEDAGTIVHANIASCDAMGERLEEYRQKHADLVAEVQEVYERKQGAERQAIQTRYRKRFKAAWAMIRPGMMKCRTTPKVNRVVHEIWGDDSDAGQ